MVIAVPSFVHNFVKFVILTPERQTIQLELKLGTVFFRGEGV